MRILAVVLLSAGVGITPMISALNVIRQQQPQPLTFMGTAASHANGRKNRRYRDVI